MASAPRGAAQRAFFQSVHDIAMRHLQSRSETEKHSGGQDSPMVKASTQPSTRISASRGKFAGLKRTSAALPHIASSRPSTPATNASKKLR